MLFELLLLQAPEQHKINPSIIIKPIVIQLTHSFEDRNGISSSEAYRYAERDAFYFDCIARFNATQGHKIADFFERCIAAEEWAAAETKKRFGQIPTAEEIAEAEREAFVDSIDAEEVRARRAVTITLAGPDGTAIKLSLDEALEALNLN